MSERVLRIAVVILFVFSASFLLAPNFSSHSASGVNKDLAAGLELLEQRCNELSNRLDALENGASVRKADTEANPSSDGTYSSASRQDRELARIATATENIANYTNQASDRWLRQISQDITKLSGEIYYLRQAVENLK